MSRDNYAPQDDENRQVSDDIIRFQKPPSSQSQRRREARDEKLRRMRQPSSQRDRGGRYRETDQAVTRPRQTRNFRQEEERGSPYRQVSPQTEPGQETRIQRPSRERDYADERYTTTPRRREIDTEADRYAGYETPRRPVRRSGTRSSAPPVYVEPPPRRRSRRRRSVWSTLLIGVVGGIVTIALVVGIGWFFLIHTLQVKLPGLGIGTSTFTSPQQTLPLNITSSITKLQVINNAGNISISDDSTKTTGGTVTYVKKTQASSSSNAASDFARIAVAVQPGNSPACPQASCLVVGVSMPANIAASVDMTVVLPTQNPTPQFVLNAKTQTGNITVQNFNGLLTLTDDTGKIDVKGGLLDAGSCLQDRFGNISFAGTLETGTAPTINPCQGNPITSPNSTQPWYSITTGTGNLDVTLNSVSTNIILDAVVFNQGRITSDYPIAIPAASPPSYTGPLLPGTHPAAQLLLEVDTGTISLHKV